MGTNDREQAEPGQGRERPLRPLGQEEVDEQQAADDRGQHDLGREGEVVEVGLRPGQLREHAQASRSTRTSATGRCPMAWRATSTAGSITWKIRFGYTPSTTIMMSIGVQATHS